MNKNMNNAGEKISGSNTQQSSPSASIEQYEKIVDRAHTEIEGVRTVYKWLLGFILTAVTIVSAVGIYYSYQSLNDFKAEIRTEGNRLKVDLTKESTDLASSLKKELEKKLSDDVSKLSDEVRKRVEREFQTSVLTELIRSTAVAHVQNVADPLITKEIDTRLTPKIIATENRLATLDHEIGAARGTRDDLRERSQFAMTVIFAQNDDRKSFDQLKTWSEDPKFLFKDEAQQAWLKILDEHATPFSTSGFTVPWAEGVDPSKLSFADLKRDFPNAQAYVRLGLLEYLWKTRDDATKKDRMQFLADTLQSDKSLRVVEYAGRFFTEESKQKIKPLAVDVLLDWWNKNKADYEKTQPTNAPYSSPAVGSKR